MNSKFHTIIQIGNSCVPCSRAFGKGPGVAMSDADDDFDFLLQLAEMDAAGGEDPREAVLPALLRKDADALLEEAYGKEHQLAVHGNCSDSGPRHPGAGQRTSPKRAPASTHVRASDHPLRGNALTGTGKSMAAGHSSGRCMACA